MSDRNFSASDHSHTDPAVDLSTIPTTLAGHLPLESAPQNSEPSIRALSENVRNLHHQAQIKAQESQQLRSRVNWLTGLLAASLLILGGGLVGATLSLRQEQATLRSAQGELADQLEAASDAKANVDQLAGLAEQLQSLTQQAKGLSEQARSITKGLPEGLPEGLPNVSSKQWTELQNR